jgi:hypothetical protein
MERLSRRIRDVERRNAIMVEALGVDLARARKDQPGKHRAETHRDGHHPTNGASRGARSLGTIALKGRS